ncbi:hypothetical protein GCM10010478_63010 [Streptomyces erythrogriseus]|uniref:Uncharacterized protein n=1 Tax=Streptomyces erythrogriseus TaxID=284027 RepID=A0ABP6JXQ5_9ACTN
MRGCGAVGVARAHAAEPHMPQPRPPWDAALTRHRNKRAQVLRNPYRCLRTPARVA